MVGARVNRVGVVAVSALAAVSVLVGCGSDGEPLRSATAALGADLPVSDGDSYGPVYESFAELAAVSELVVIGEVTSQVSLGVPDASDDPNADEYIGLTVGIERTLIGAPEPTGEVTIAWDAFITEVTDGGTRARVRRLVWDGVSMPDVGDRLLLFLAPTSAETSALYPGGISHEYVSLDGVLYIEEGGHLLTEIEGEWHFSRDLIGKTVDEAADLLEVEAARPLTPAECESLRSAAEKFGVVADLQSCPGAPDA